MSALKCFFPIPYLPISFVSTSKLCEFYRSPSKVSESVYPVSSKYLIFGGFIPYSTRVRRENRLLLGKYRDKYISFCAHSGLNYYLHFYYLGRRLVIIRVKDIFYVWSTISDEGPHKVWDLVLTQLMTNCVK